MERVPELHLFGTSQSWKHNPQLFQKEYIQACSSGFQRSIPEKFNGISTPSFESSLYRSNSSSQFYVKSCKPSNCNYYENAVRICEQNQSLNNVKGHNVGALAVSYLVMKNEGKHGKRACALCQAQNISKTLHFCGLKKAQGNYQNSFQVQKENPIQEIRLHNSSFPNFYQKQTPYQQQNKYVPNQNCQSHPNNYQLHNNNSQAHKNHSQPHQNNQTQMQKLYAINLHENQAQRTNSNQISQRTDNVSVKYLNENQELSKRTQANYSSPENNQVDMKKTSSKMVSFQQITNTVIEKQKNKELKQPSKETGRFENQNDQGNFSLQVLKSKCESLIKKESPQTSFQPEKKESNERSLLKTVSEVSNSVQYLQDSVIQRNSNPQQKGRRESTMNRGISVTLDQNKGGMNLENNKLAYQNQKVFQDMTQDQRVSTNISQNAKIIQDVSHHNQRVIQNFSHQNQREIQEGSQNQRVFPEIDKLLFELKEFNEEEEEASYLLRELEEIADKHLRKKRECIEDLDAVLRRYGNESERKYRGEGLDGSWERRSKYDFSPSSKRRSRIFE